MRRPKLYYFMSVLLLFVFLITGLIGCGKDAGTLGSNPDEDSNSSEESSDDSVKVGVLLSFTGPYAPLAEGSKTVLNFT